MNGSETVIAPPLLFMSIVLSLLWGDHLADQVKAFAKHRDARSVNSMVVTLAVVGLCTSYLWRTIFVLVGAGDEAAGRITFFVLLAPTLIGGLLVFYNKHRPKRLP